MKNILLVASVILFMLKPANAQNEHYNKEEALAETQKLLKDQSLRNKAIDNDEAKKADRNAGFAVGGDSTLKEELYSISADLMPWLIKLGQDDPKKMQEILQKAKRDPSSIKELFESMPDAEKRKIRALAEKIENKNKKNNP